MATLVEPTQAGFYPRIVTHEQALDAAKNFIDAHFNNRDGRGVLTGVPARPDHDDLVLVDYIKQRQAAEQSSKAEIERLQARVAELEAVASGALHLLRGIEQAYAETRQVGNESVVKNLADKIEALLSKEQP